MYEEGSVTGEDFGSGYTYLLGWVSIYLLALLSRRDYRRTGRYRSHSY